jgi:hypothetical protein
MREPGFQFAKLKEERARIAALLNSQPDVHGNVPEPYLNGKACWGAFFSVAVVVVASAAAIWFCWTLSSTVCATRLAGSGFG